MWLYNIVINDDNSPIFAIWVMFENIDPCDAVCVLKIFQINKNKTYK